MMMMTTMMMMMTMMMMRSLFQMSLPSCFIAHQVMMEKTVPGQLAVHNASHGSHQQYAHLETHLCFRIAKTRYVHMFNLIWPLRIFARTMQILQMRTLLGELLPKISSQFTLQHFLKFAYQDFSQQRFSTEMKKKDPALFLSRTLF